MNDFVDKNLIDSSYQFALKIVKITQNVQNEKKEYVLSKQLLRSGTSIGAILTETKFTENKEEVVQKLTYALSDIYKTKYWMTLLLTVDNVSQSQYNSTMNDCKLLHNGLKQAITSLQNS